MFHQQIMAESPWLAVAVAVLVVHAATLVYAWLQRPDGTQSSAGGTDTTTNVATSSQRAESEPLEHQTNEGIFIRCRDCGTENEAGYRFCRSCVTELPGSTDIMIQPPDSSGRHVR